jgi:hypothetical protein
MTEFIAENVHKVCINSNQLLLRANAKYFLTLPHIKSLFQSRGVNSAWITLKMEAAFSAETLVTTTENTASSI